MAKRDIQGDLAVIVPETVSLTSAPADFNSTGRSVQGFSRGYMVAFSPSRAIVTGDDITYKFQSSATVGGTYTDLTAAAILPTWKQAGGNTIEAPVSPFIQTAGQSCDEYEFVRCQLSSTALTANIDIDVIVIMEAEQKQFNGWTATPPPADDLP